MLLFGASAAVLGAVGTGAVLRRRSAAPFPDVAAGDPVAEAVRWAHETGVQPALSATAYSPETTVTRGDAALALHRLAGAPAVELAEMPVLFTDLGEDPARVTALLWLHGRGALWGDAELRVHPDEPATRDCAASMLAALLRPALAGVGVTWDPSPEVSLPSAEEPDPARADLAWLLAAGMATSSLAERAGDDAVTRADLALALHRANTVITDALD